MVRTKTTINWAYYERNNAADESTSCSAVPMISQDPSVATENSILCDSAESPTSSHPPLGDLKAMLQFLMEERRQREAKEERESKERQAKEEKDQKERAIERTEREAKEERERKEREAKEERREKERERERQEREIERKEREAKEERQLKEREEERERDHRARLEFFQRVEQSDLQWAERSEKRSNLRFKKIEEALLAVAAARNVTEPEIKAEESMVLEGASFDDMKDTETEAESSEMNSFHADSETNDSTWDGPQDELLVRDLAIVSTEPTVKENADSVSSEASMDCGFTPSDSSQKMCGISSTLVGGKRSTPEPESPVVTNLENPSESEPSWIFQSPESGERAWNPDFESQVCEARLCDEVVVDSLPMVFSVKNRTVTVIRVGVVQFLGEKSMDFSVVQCSNPCSDFWCGFGHDSVRSVSSCGFSGRQRCGSVWSPSSDDAVNSKNLRRNAGSRYYPVLTVQSLTVTCLDPRRYADAEFWKNPVFQSTQRGAEIKVAGYNLMCIPMVMLKSNRYIALGANPSSLAKFPMHLPQPPGSQQVVVWSFKLEFGIT